MFDRPLRHTRLAIVVGCCTLIPGVLHATPSGLNNIPTTEVTPPKVLVFQTFANFGSDQPTRYVGGIKYGPAANWEIGYDGRVSESGTGTGVTGAGGAPSGGATFHVKRRWVPRQGSTGLAIGLANLSVNTDRAGDPVAYLVASKGLPRCNLHLGYAVVKGSNNLFAGMDIHANNGWTLRFDFNNLNRTSALLSSAGFIHSLGKRWVVEGWWSIARTPGVNDTLTLKIDYVLTP